VKFQERENVLQRLKAEGKESLLEIGAGPGRDSLYFQQQGFRVVTIDFSEERW
jgi:cyclopropane fatty-acyl-phospholipid synthase-like methyltransferase